MTASSMPESSNGPTATVVPVLSRDVKLMLAQLKVALIRASLVDTASMAAVASWSSGVQANEADMSSALVAVLLPKLQGVSTDRTLAHKMGPNYWAFAWRVDEGHVGVATAFYLDRRETHSPADTALVRLVCDVGLHGGTIDAPASDTVPSPMTWPAFERRRLVRSVASTRRRFQTEVAAAVLILALTLGSAFVTFRQAEAQRAGAAQLRSLTEGALTQTLSAALATGDYGDVQSMLSSFASLGYFKGAAVTNVRQRVVATAGKVGAARVGDEVPPSVTLSARSFDLGLGSSLHGQLLVLGLTAEQTSDLDLRWPLLATVAGSLACGALSALLLARHRARSPLSARAQ